MAMKAWMRCMLLGGMLTSFVICIRPTAARIVIR
jgi:hypothetical protein